MDLLNSILYILIGILILLFLVFFFRKQIKKVWFKLPFFEGGIEAHANTEIRVIQNSRLGRKDGRSLRKIDDMETGKNIKDLPPDIYGYAHASYIDSALSLLSRHRDLELTNLQKTNWYFEVRKERDDVLLVGYISKDSLSRIKDGKTINVTVFAQPWEEFKNKVCIPFSKITKSLARTIDTKTGDIRILEIKTREITVL